MVKLKKLNRILFLGRNALSSRHKYLCLKNICKSIDIIDASNILYFEKITGRIFFHVSSKIFASLINWYVVSKIKKQYDLIFVDDGEFINEKLINFLKTKTTKIIYYCNDNPFVKRDKKKWQLSLPSLKHYDLIIFHNKSRIKPSKKYGVKNYLLVLPSYQKKIHTPQGNFGKKYRKYKYEVIFIGTWEPYRGVFFKKLIENGINIKIFGNLWHKDKYYDFLKPYIILGHVHDPNYSKLIYHSKIAICLPSVGNNDDITKRSIEIPAIGTLLMAKKTETHTKTFIDNQEAIFFKDAKDCYTKCKELLPNQRKIEKISYKGHLKVTKILKTDFESVIKNIVKKTFGK